MAATFELIDLKFKNLCQSYVKTPPLQHSHDGVKRITVNLFNDSQY